jgi:hypothetical protein
MRIEEHPMNREKFSSIFAKLILIAVSMSSMLALGTQPATAQAIIVTTPFTFSAGSQSYPAGTYQFTRLSEWSLSIRNADGGGETFFAIRPEAKIPPKSQGGLTFSNSEGHLNLQAVYLPGAYSTAELLQQGTRSKRVKPDIASASTSTSSEKATAGNQNATGR